MMQSIYSAKMGLIAQQQRTDTIANNIANISTTGFKSSRVSFKDALYATMKSPVEGAESKNLQRGHGVLLSATSRSFAQGFPVETGVPLDMRIEGDGFFVLSGDNDGLNYTRNGSFAVSVEGDTQYLVNAQGYYVMDTALNKIELPNDIEDISVNVAGEIYVNDISVATLNIAAFTNNAGLEATKNSFFVETEASGEPIAAESATVYQGSLEGSNVDIALEMTKLIRAQRAFTLVSKALTTSDEMSALANRMRG
ncbi:MAG: flagellar hook-basal body protein [Clostridiales bacterium]|nr:flagellar hook-basal body protein [Clostridiales bacterium]